MPSGQLSRSKLGREGEILLISSAQRGSSDCKQGNRGVKCIYVSSPACTAGHSNCLMPGVSVFASVFLQVGRPHTHTSQHIWCFHTHTRLHEYTLCSLRHTHTHTALCTVQVFTQTPSSSTLIPCTSDGFPHTHTHTHHITSTAVVLSCHTRPPPGY